MWKDVFMLKVLKGFPICEAQSDDARWAFTLFLGGASIMHPGVTIAIGAKRHLPGALGWHGWEQSAELVVIYHWYLSAEMNESWPIGSMYGIYANIGGILMVNVTIYSIHGSYGWCIKVPFANPQYNYHHGNQNLSITVYWPLWPTGLGEETQDGQCSLSCQYHV